MQTQSGRSPIRCECASVAGVAARVAPPAAVSLRADMTRRWSSGDVVVLRYLGRIRAGMPAIVVEDSSKRVIVYVPDGVQWFGAPAPAAGRTERVRAIARAETAVTGHLIPWYNHMLRVLLPGQPFSVWLFWSPAWEFKSYYVNLEAPFARSAVGFDSSDHTLDVCVRAESHVVLQESGRTGRSRRGGPGGCKGGRPGAARRGAGGRADRGLAAAVRFRTRGVAARSVLARAGAATGVGCARFGDRALAADIVRGRQPLR